MSKAAITKLVDSLEGQECLERVPDSDDLRATLASLTPFGREVLQHAESTFEAHMEDGLWRHVSSREAAMISQVLGRVRQELGLPTGGVLPPQS